MSESFAAPRRAAGRFVFEHRRITPGAPLKAILKITMSHISAFLPSTFDATNWSQIQPVIEQLKSRPVGSPADFERWLVDRSDLDAACSEARANLYIATSCDTDNTEKAKAYERYIEEIGPKLEVASFELDKLQVGYHAKFPLSKDRYHVLERSKKVCVELFREENVPIQTELAKLSQDYGKISGAQTVMFDGEERTLPQMTQFLLSPDRGIRERAWRGISDRRLKDRAALDDLIDKMIVRRDQLAKNAGCATYVEYAFKEKQRFDYTPKDCETFWNAVEKHVTPLIRRIDAQRKKKIK